LTEFPLPGEGFSFAKTACSTEILSHRKIFIYLHPVIVLFFTSKRLQFDQFSFPILVYIYFQQEDISVNNSVLCLELEI